MDLDANITIRKKFERDGFYIQVESILPEDIITGAVAGLEMVKEGGSDTGEEPDSRAWKPGDDPFALCKIEQPQLASRALQKALKSPRLGELAAEIMGAERVQVWWVQGLMKPGIPEGQSSAFAKVGWHQDLRYWSAWEEGSELFTAWIALSDVTADSGPMVFVPGSHLWGLLPGGDFFGQDLAALHSGLKIPKGETWRETVDLLPAGGVSFHHRLLFHGSHQNVSPTPRRSLAIHLRTENSTPSPGSWVAKYLDRPEICPVIYQK